MATTAPAPPPAATMQEYYGTDLGREWIRAPSQLNSLQLIHADGNRNTAPAAVKDLIGRQPREGGVMILMGVDNERAPIITEMVQYPQPGMGESPRPEYHWRLWAAVGDVLSNQIPSYELPSDLMKQTPNVLHWNPDKLITMCQADPNLEWVDPPAQGDADSESNRTRYGLIVQPKDAGMCRALGGDSSEYFRTLLPQAKADGREAEMLAQSRWHAINLQRTTNPAHAADNSQPEFLDKSVLQRAEEPKAPSRQIPELVAAMVAKHTALCPGAYAPTPQVPGDLNVTLQKYIDDRNEERQRVADAKAEKERVDKSIKTKVGEASWDRLVSLQFTSNELQMGEYWRLKAKTSTKEFPSVLKGALQKRARSLKYTDLQFSVTAAGLAAVDELTPYSAIGDVSQGGGVANTFSALFAQPDVHKERNIQVALSLMGSHGAGNMTWADAKTLSKQDTVLPTNETIYDTLRRQHCWVTLVESPLSPWRQWIERTVTDIIKQEPRVRRHEMVVPSDEVLKGVHIANYVTAIGYNFHRSLLEDDIVEDLPKPEALVSAMRMGSVWTLNLSSRFLVSMKVSEFRRVQNSLLPRNTPPSPPPPPQPAPPAPQPGQPAPQPGQPQPAPQPGGRGGRSVANPFFNSGLFEQYRCRPVRARKVRDLISAGSLPALPLSRIDQGPMCLGWHVKGMCNDNCPRAADHVVYNSIQYEPMDGWCGANYPESE
mmetsp:Transcript_3069/g.6900  ORF Transcript_3069/g.6900 Transcript_3069/m.6900 type:complete len:715 (+) Transcript_3069:2251-4395(+)